LKGAAQMSKNALSQREIIRIAADVGAKAALEKIEKEKNKASKGRYDRRLRNTKLLLRNYRTLKSHCENAIFERAGIVAENMNAIDILDSIDEYLFNETFYVESIKRTTERTAIILAHIDEMMRIFEILCHQSGRLEDARRYRVVKALYIDEQGLIAEEIAENEKINVRTVYKDIDIASERLTALFFGIDGLQRAL